MDQQARRKDGHLWIGLKVEEPVGDREHGHRGGSITASTIYLRYTLFSDSGHPYLVEKVVAKVMAKEGRGEPDREQSDILQHDLMQPIPACGSLDTGNALIAHLVGPGYAPIQLEHIEYEVAAYYRFEGTLYVAKATNAPSPDNMPF